MRPGGLRERIKISDNAGRAETSRTRCVNWLQSGVKVSWFRSSEKLILPSSFLLLLTFFGPVILKTV